MDEAVKRALACLLLAVSNLAGAQALQDPTRPPAALMSAAAGRAATAPEHQAPRLQSVLIARQQGGRHVAVIDGDTVRLGELYKGARVTRIEANEVELMRGQSRQVLTLHAAAATGRAGAGIERVPNE